MSKVVLTIGGRDYPMTCAAGEEAHIGELGRMIDGKLATLPESTTQNDSRALLFAALLLADELHELRKAPGTAAAAQADGDVPPERLDALARRLEALVHGLGVAA